MKEYFPGYAEKAERRKLRSLTGMALAVVAGLVIAGVATCANAAPRVAGPQECDLVADMVLVAASLERVKAPEKLRADLMHEIYATPLGGEAKAKWHELMRLAVRFANKAAAVATPQELAQGINEGCKQNRGNLDSILGTGLDT